MKQTVLGEPLDTFEKKLKWQSRGRIFAVAALLCLNIWVCSLRTDENHRWLLLLNIISDILVGGWLLYYTDTRIRLMRTLVDLVIRPKRTFQAQVLKISTKTRRIPGLTCVPVQTDKRTVYLPLTDTIHLKENESYTFCTVDNVIVEVAQ